MSSTSTERDYVLGTHDAEIDRLGLQHRVWRSTVLETWTRAGLRRGRSALDVGAGPGLATIDLAEIVGPEGHVTAVERSARFAEHGRAQCRARGLQNVEFHELDLMTDALPGVHDLAWCRWVACFVSSRPTLVRKISQALKPGGVAVFHEYIDYRTYRVYPPRQSVDEFVREAMASWRDAGGEPDVAPELMTLLPAAGLRVRETTPRLWAATPQDERWNWPSSYVRIGSQRLQELGRVTPAWVEGVHRDLREAQADPASRFVTPLLLEIVAEKVG